MGRSLLPFGGAPSVQGLITQYLGPFTQWVAGILNVNSILPGATPAQWRPPQWQTDQQWSMTVTTPGATPDVEGETTTYFFDAVFRAVHEQRAEITHHPVQAGAAISDHMYLEAARIVLEIGMSDVMEAYTTGQYGGGVSKSIAAYNTFLDIQSSKVPISLATRLKSYENIAIHLIVADDTAKTRFGLRVAITFQEVIQAQVSTQGVNVIGQAINKLPLSLSPQITKFSNLGQKIGLPVPSSLSKFKTALPTSVVNPGNWSSVPFVGGHG